MYGRREILNVYCIIIDGVVCYSIVGCINMGKV